MRPEPPLITRRDGKREQRFDDGWLVEYYEERESGLWRADVFHHDTPEWSSSGHLSLTQAQQAVREHLDQR